MTQQCSLCGVVLSNNTGLVGKEREKGKGKRREEWRRKGKGREQNRREEKGEE